MQDGIGEKFAQLFQFVAAGLMGFAIGFSKGWELTLLLFGVTPLVQFFCSRFIDILVGYCWSFHDEDAGRFERNLNAIYLF